MVLCGASVNSIQPFFGGIVFGTWCISDYYLKAAAG